MISETRRRLIEQIDQARDWRSDEQRIAEAVARHLANIDLCEGLAAARQGEVPASAPACACEDSQADLYRLVEDHCLVDPRKLGKALAHALP
ncbi:hypothetical protein [Sphingosinicella rhizophila]|uniref:Uncharacterized protein n=1 Tax=Sphingosinicella rhizophila TaxID=3050082 RepID=A0ABU3Q9G3_9SPHN|nr:hypothetical protein [Sphingosinicella sp. GR2756]MDT9600048.1 hypothetical protein [Sphingosinicella sp. GR2756]